MRRKQDRWWSMPEETSEVRVVNEKTGGEKGQKLDRYDLLPFDMLFEDALLYGAGARKYADRNWEKGYAYGLSVRAVMSHLVAWVLGEDRDPETGAHHMAAVRFHAAALYRFSRENPGLDNVRMSPEILAKIRAVMSEL